MWIWKQYHRHRDCYESTDQVVNRLEGLPLMLDLVELVGPSPLDQIRQWQWSCSRLKQWVSQVHPDSNVPHSSHSLHCFFLQCHQPDFYVYACFGVLQGLLPLKHCSLKAWVLFVFSSFDLAFCSRGEVNSSSFQSSQLHLST